MNNKFLSIAFLRTALWMTLVIVASMLLSEAVVALVRLWVPAATLRANNEVAGNYLQTLGTVYAVLLAFVVYVVWNQFNEARNAVDAEANELADLARVARDLPAPINDEVVGRIREYVKAVVGEEWPLLARGEMSGHARRHLEEVWQRLQRCEPTTLRVELLLGDALDRFNDLSDCRLHRLTAARTRLPPTMWTLLIVGALMTAGSMAFFGMDSASSHFTMTGALSGLIGFMLYVVYDLDNPFIGDWRVRPDPIAHSLAPLDVVRS